MPDQAADAQLELEVIPVRAVEGGVDCLLRLDGGALRLPWPASGSAHHAVVEATTGIGLTPLVCHSTSWRQDGPVVVVTYLVAVGHGHSRTTGYRYHRIQPAQLRRGRALAAPAYVSEVDAARHGLSHLAWLHVTDPEVGAALPDWAAALAAFGPEPFGILPPSVAAPHLSLVKDAGGEPDPSSPRLLLRPEEAARVLAIGRSKLYELLASGDLESVCIGSSRRIPADALRRFVFALQQAAET